MPRRSAKPPAPPSMIVRLMEDLRRQGRYSIDDLAQAMAERMDAWSPGRAEMRRHLTERQAIRLLNDDRLERAIRLNDDLAADDLDGSIVLPNARLMLSELTGCGGAKLTEAGFLNRRFVMHMGGKLEWPELDWRGICSISKAVREEEVTPLWFLHGILKLSGLVYVRRGVLKAGKRSSELMSSERDGALQETLFRTAWCDFNLAGLSASHLAGRLRRQANLALFMIGRLADDWIEGERLLRAAVVPDGEIIAAMETLPAYAFEGCILQPLRWFGLIEKRSLPTEIEWKSRREFRKTPLYDRFLAFDPGAV